MSQAGPGASRHLVWDWNGTLVDDLPLVVAATNVALAAAGGPEVGVDEHRRDFRRPIVDYYADVLGRPVGEAEFARLDRIFQDAYQAGLPCPLTVDAEDALTSWAGPQSLLSMWTHPELTTTVARYGLGKHFARVDGRREPDGALCHKAPLLAAHLRHLGRAGDEVVLVGDTVDDQHAAAAVGARCVLYTGGFTEERQLRATGAPVVTSLTEAVALAADLP